jgi:hypothetical protein
MAKYGVLMFLRLNMEEYGVWCGFGLAIGCHGWRWKRVMIEVRSTNTSDSDENILKRFDIKVVIVGFGNGTRATFRTIFLALSHLRCHINVQASQPPFTWSLIIRTFNSQNRRTWLIFCGLFEEIIPTFRTSFETCPYRFPNLQNQDAHTHMFVFIGNFLVSSVEVVRREGNEGSIYTPEMT